MSETSTILAIVFLSSLLISITSYCVYVGFGPPAQELRDPFEEHED